MVKIVSSRYSMSMSMPHLLQLIERLGNLLRAEQRRAAPELQAVHLQVLDYLARCNRYSDTPAAVARYLGATKGTTSQSLAVLERHGYIARAPDARDRRVVHLQLSERGRELLANLVSAAEWRQALAALPEAERATAERVLEEFLRRLQAARGWRTFGQCHSCRHLLREGKGFRCGLTREALSAADTGQICHEHEPAP